MRVTRTWWAPADRILVVVLRPRPLILTVPRALRLTVTSRALPLSLALAILSDGGAGPLIAPGLPG